MVMNVDDVSILMVDMDEATLPFDKERYESEARKIVEFFGHEVVGITYRLSTHKGIHIYVWIKPEIESMRVPLLQYLLGSDSKRECINFFRFIKGIDINVLFAGKQRVDRHVGINMDCYSMCRGLIREIRMAERMGLKRIRV